MIKINHSLTMQVHRIGDQRTPVIVLDDVLQDITPLLSCAGEIDSFSKDTTDYYPGVRKPLPEEYRQQLVAWIQSSFAEVIGMAHHETGAIDVTIPLSAFSLTCTPPNQLLPIQCIPHFDTVNPHQWAMVHYLCDATCGGTGFFRHKRSGFEVITQAQQTSYFRMLADDASVSGVPRQDYLSLAALQDDSALFDMIFSVEAKPNRAVLYPSSLLHSGLIKRWQVAKPREGRLTANTFFRVSLSR